MATQEHDGNLRRQKLPTYAQDWPALSQRLGLLASEITEPEHVRSYLRHVMSQDGNDVVSVSARIIRTIPIDGHQVLPYTPKIAQEMLEQERLLMRRGNQRITWERLPSGWDGPQAA